MTPAVTVAKKAGIAFQTHEYRHDPAHASYGLEAAEKLGLDPARVFKTLVADVEGKGMVVAVLPVAHKLDLKALATAAGGKRAAMADKAQVMRSSGYVLGGVSPLGQKKKLPTYIDCSAQSLETVFVSAGRRGLEIELAPADLLMLTDARFADLCQQGGA